MNTNEFINTKQLFFSLEGQFQRLPLNPSYDNNTHITDQGDSMTILPELQLQLNTQELKK